MNSSRLIRMAGISAVTAGILFVIIQPIHPPDTLASVSTSTWATVHYLTLAMTLLFLVGITGIYARQIEETGWIGLVGYLMLGLGLLITAAFVFLEAFVSPVLAEHEPAFVQGLLHLVEGEPGTVDLGALPALWSASGVLFPLGCLVFGIATWRAAVLPKWASGVFALGLPIAVIALSMLPFDLHRLGAIPVGVGLAWLGGALWAGQRPTDRRGRSRAFSPHGVNDAAAESRAHQTLPGTRPRRSA